MNSENPINNNNIQANANQLDTNIMANQTPNMPQNTANNVQSSGETGEKKSGKIIFNEDPITFEIKEIKEEKNETDNVNDVQINNPIEKTELPKEQSGNITF